MSFTHAQIDSNIKQIWKLKDSLTATHSRADRAIILIGACIELGFDTKPLILKWLRVSGLAPKHVARQLDENTGTIPGLHVWMCDDEGRYRLIEPLEPQAAATENHITP